MSDEDTFDYEAFDDEAFECLPPFKIGTFKVHKRKMPVDVDAHSGEAE